ncbi:MAG: 2-amino-4-hydroxy-6-hydroxymethyldihydropteridine diphosphokinase [Firmicutes bacterium]|nr:2-amino-4-hydroxy-6-hydroxymethyldihydropteridine diphosphokinase [Bacillota bacterium]MCM1400722.1 2-amino-4-hydroxy-6-hydroxymethyldihydropteridine diphosphokinase [Bacteroides sp.]MCM1476416.1 2-amino-4-hydroxy-6-hydroxymethyldihydropteridine diphosphokinase [Bacteroides sp.]
MPIAHINIGSNIGNRLALIERAVSLIEASVGTPVRRASVIESAPWGYSSPNPFLNLGIAFEVPPGQELELFEKLQQIQNSISVIPHRSADGSYADRPIDIDLIAIGSSVVNLPQLVLPHPRMHLRHFVLRPMMQLQPHWVHPLLGMTPEQMLHQLQNSCK